MSATRILLILLAIQVVLGALTWWPEDRSALVPHPLLEIEETDIQEITVTRKPVEGEEPDVVRLVRVEDGWEVATSGSYPATTSKVEDLIDHLLGIAVRAPIATQATSHDALKVGEQEYGRKVAIKTTDGDVELVVGSAASKSIHVRVVGETDVYTANGISEWSLRDRGASYYDSQYVTADADQLLTFSVHRESGDLVFTRNGTQWTLQGVPEGRQVDAERVGSFIGDAIQVRLTQPVGREEEERFGLADGTRIDWSFEDESQTVAGGFVIGAADGDDSFIKALDSEFVVKASNTKLDPLREKTVADFLVDGDDEAPALPSAP